MQPDESPPQKRKWPRKGVIIRAAIYLPLLAFFGWQAVDRHLDERRMADDNFRIIVDQWLAVQPKTIMMPNGELMPVFEVSEQEAVQMGLMPEPEAKP